MWKHLNAKFPVTDAKQYMRKTHIECFGKKAQHQYVWGKTYNHNHCQHAAPSTYPGAVQAKVTGG